MSIFSTYLNSLHDVIIEYIFQVFKQGDYTIILLFQIGARPLSFAKGVSEMPVKSNKRRSKGSGSIILRGKKYYLETTIEGKRIQKALRTENKQEAQKLAKELLPNLQARTKEEITAKVAEARKLSAQNKVPINKTWELFYNSSLRKQSTSEGTLKNYQRNWKKFKSWLKSADFLRPAPKAEKVFSAAVPSGLSCSRNNLLF